MFSFVEQMADVNPEAIVLDGFDECILGLGVTEGMDILVYSQKMIIEVLKENMTEDEAVEYYDFNIRSAFFGQYNPVILEDL